MMESIANGDGDLTVRNGIAKERTIVFSLTLLIVWYLHHQLHGNIKKSCRELWQCWQRVHVALKKPRSKSMSNADKQKQIIGVRRDGSERTGDDQ